MVWARQTGRKVVVATNPMFPETAILQRVQWAGFPEDGAGFDLVTTIENSHATKAHSEYYSESESMSPSCSRTRGM